MEQNARVFRRTEGLLERDTGDAVVVMMENGDILHTLRGTALFIWKRIDGIRTTASILADLVSEYDVDKVQAAADLEMFLDALVKNGLASTQEKEYTHNDISNMPQIT